MVGWLRRAESVVFWVWRSTPGVWVLFATSLLFCPPRAVAQSTLERTPNLSAGFVGVPGFAYLLAPNRFYDGRTGEGVDIAVATTFDLSYGLPFETLAGLRFSAASEIVPGDSDEWEAYARFRALAQGRGAPVDLAVTAAYNRAARSADGALTAARWFGPLRLLAEGRVLSAPFGGDEVRFAVAAGGVLHVRAGAWPIALAGDVATLGDRGESEDRAWSAGLQIGVPHTDNTVSLHAANNATTTLQGTSIGSDAVRWGVELTVPFAAPGRVFGVFAPRRRALESVVPEPTADAGEVVYVPIRRYAYGIVRLEVQAGTTVEWQNLDAVVHTVTAEDHSFDSGAIEQGERWRARFEQPGRYPYLCGPHPYMKAIVIVT